MRRGCAGSSEAIDLQRSECLERDRGRVLEGLAEGWIGSPFKQIQKTEGKKEKQREEEEEEEERMECADWESNDGPERWSECELVNGLCIYFIYHVLISLFLHTYLLSYFYHFSCSL